MTVQERLATGLRLLLGAVFVYASLSKIADPAAFSRTVYHYQLLPGWAVNPVAIILPWIELLVGVLLVIGVRLRGALVVAITSLVVFLVAMSTALARGLNIDCGCFSASGTPLGMDRIIGDLVLIAACVFVYRASVASYGPRPTTSRIAEPGLKETS
jgi:putative oxidoreductase